MICLCSAPYRPNFLPPIAISSAHKTSCTYQIRRKVPVLSTHTHTHTHTQRLSANLPTDLNWPVVSNNTFFVPYHSVFNQWKFLFTWQLQPYYANIEDQTRIWVWIVQFIPDTQWKTLYIANSREMVATTIKKKKEEVLLCYFPAVDNLIFE